MTSPSRRLAADPLVPHNLRPTGAMRHDETEMAASKMTALSASMAAGLPPVRRLSRPLSAMAQVEAIAREQGAEAAPKFWVATIMLAVRHLTRIGGADASLAVLAEVVSTLDPADDDDEVGVVH